jgi:hypothetical protein
MEPVLTLFHEGFIEKQVLGAEPGKSVIKWKRVISLFLSLSLSFSLSLSLSLCLGGTGV